MDRQCDCAAVLAGGVADGCQRLGHRDADGRGQPLEVWKRYAIPADRAEVRVDYRLTNPGADALQLADAFRARVVDATTESFIFELTGKPSKIDEFVDLMRPIGLVEVSRTGVAAISRGPEPI